MTGWGQVLQPFLSGDVFIQNEAVNGRSTKSFIDEHRLEWISLCLREGDRLLIGFGHNDEKAEDPSRYTSPDDTFLANLDRFICVARQRGASPVLFTPVVRRRFDENGRLVPTHGDYPAVIRKLAEDHRIPLVDLESTTSTLVGEAGPEGTRQLYCHVPAGHPIFLADTISAS